MTSLLALRPEEAARLVAIDLLARADVACAQLAHDDVPPHALHDVRVALRRLRTVLRSFPRELASSVPRHAKRRLRDLASATGAGRDADVQIAWLTGQRDALSSRHGAGADWFGDRLQERRAEVHRGLGEDIQRAFARVHRKLGRALATYEVTLRVGDVAPPPRFADALAARVRESAGTLARRLAAVTGADDAHGLHRARIAAKRLRYLLEIAAPTVPRADDAVESLKRLQDALGAIHDRDVLADELNDAVDAARPSRSAAAPQDPRPGLRSLARLARAERAEHFDSLASDWLGATPSFVDVVDHAAQAIVAAGAAEAGAGAAPLEIERKYLLRALPPVAAAAPHVDIEQGWIPGDRLVERLRRSTRDGTERFHRTVKTGAGLVRVEIEEETTAELFAALWPLTHARRIAKRRYLVEDGANTWEIDEIRAPALVLAEIELPGADVVPTLPEWLAPYVVREVTDDPAFTNYALAGDGDH